MSRFRLRILKEDATIKDPKQKKKDNMSKIILAGDSIAVGVGIWGLKQKGARCCGVTTFDNIVPIFPAVRGAQATKWIKAQLINQLNSGKSFTGHKLIIIAGTNDSLGYGLSPSNKTITDAIDNIKDMVDTAISKGIKKEDIAIMKLAKYEPSQSRLKAYIKDRKRRGWFPKDKTGEDYKKLQAHFVEKFNAGISSYNTFDMVPVNPDGVHTGQSGSKKLLNRALRVLGVKNANNVEIPTSTLPSAPTVAVSNKLTSKDCHVNPYCGCVDSSVNDQITIKGVQRALKELGFPVEETASCDKQTRTAIMAFQKQEQEKGFQPPDGREFLRCDACVGPNTLAAMNAQLKPKKKSVQGMVPASELVKVRKARLRILRSTKGSGKTLEEVKRIAAENDLHPDVVVMAAIMHSEPSCRRSHCGRWSDEGFAVFNMMINRIQANGPGHGPHHYGSRAITTDSLLWNVAVNQATTLGNQSGGYRPFATSNFPSDIKSSGEKVKEFIRKRLDEGSNIGDATFFFHADFQTHQWKLSQARMNEFGSKQETLAACRREHAAAGITYKGMKTKWPRGKYTNPKTGKEYRGYHPLRARWRGLFYGKSPDAIRDSWGRKYGPKATVTIGGTTPAEKAERSRHFRNSRIEPMGDRRAWAKDAFSESYMEQYMRTILNPLEVKQQKSEELSDLNIQTETP